MTNNKGSEPLDTIRDLASQVAASHGLTLVNARFTNQGKKRVLEITIHRPKGRVSLDDCESVSRDLDSQLDGQEMKLPLLAGPYSLSVQSPGIDRKLKTDEDFRIFKGEQVQVTAREAHESLGKSFTGELELLEGNLVSIRGPVPVPEKGKKGKKLQPSKAVSLPSSVELPRESLLEVRLHSTT